jgi:hypothetical protein
MSTLTVQKIVPRTLSQINIASGTSLGLSDSAFGGIRGTPVQMAVARTDTRTTFTSPNNGQVEIPQTAVTITPKFTGSLIVLKWMCTGEIHQDNGFRILKNGTLFKTTTQTNERWGSYVSAWYDRNQSSTMSNWYINAFDNDVVAGAETTYTLSTGSSSNGTYTFYLNRCVSNGGGNNSYENGVTVMTAMEITPGIYS